MAVTRPYIKGLIPAIGWQTNGDKLFTIHLGMIKAKELVYRDPRNPFPKKLFLSKKIFYVRRFLRVLIASSYYGFEITKENVIDLKFIFGRVFYYLYFFPILLVVKATPKKLIKLLFKVKRFIFH